MTEKQRIESNAWKIKSFIDNEGFTIYDCKNQLTIKHNEAEATKTINRYYQIMGYLQ